GLMLKASLSCALLLLGGTALAQQADGGVGAAPAETAEGGDTAEEQAAANPAPEPGGVKAMAGMSILGNQEAPKSLVIVPWKSSGLGRGIGVSRALDTRIRPVDKDGFERELRYYELRAGRAE